MIIKKYYTDNSLKQAVAMYKNEGYIFKGYTYNSAIFKGLILLRIY